MADKCKACGGTGWLTLDLKSDATHSIMIQMGIECEIACTACEDGRAEIDKAHTETAAKRSER
jgi:hypothetical protein